MGIWLVCVGGGGGVLTGSVVLINFGSLGS